MRKINVMSWPLKKKLVAGGLCVLAVVLLIVIVRSCGVATDIVYRYERVTVGEVTKTISVSGKLDVLNSYSVLSKINGIVSRVYADFNQTVRQGQVLAAIDSSEIDQQMMRVSTQLERAKLDLVGARMELDTKQSLFKDNLISAKDLEQSELNYKKIQALLKQYTIEYNIALKNKSYTKIVSPIGGVVIAREIRQMDLVTVNKLLFVIGEKLEKMYLTINIDESDIGRVARGQKVSFSVSAFPDTVFSGSIDQVHFTPINSGGIVMYEAIVLCDNSKLLLKPGMTATATVVTGHKENVKRISNEALIVSPRDMRIEPGKQYVWKKQRYETDGLPMRRIEVKTGIVGDTYTEIISDDVKTGDRVLVRIDKKLRIKDNI